MLVFFVHAIALAKRLLDKGDGKQQVKRTVIYTTKMFGWFCFGTFVFIGIEGNALLKTNYENMETRGKLTRRIEKALLEKNDSRYTTTGHFNQTLIESDIAIKVSKLEKVSTIICRMQNEKVWTFSDSLSFAKSVITTIGYGVYFPTTVLSKIICIVYATIGVPLFLHFLSYITYGLRYLNEIAKSSELLKDKDVTHITVAVIAIVVLIATLIDGTITHIFQHASDSSNLEHLREETQEILGSKITIGREHNWSYFVCIYYVFISITSIGFGDLFVHDAMGGASVIRDIFVLLILSMLIALFSFLFCLLQQNIESYAVEQVTKTMGAGRFSATVEAILKKEQEKKQKRQHKSVPSIKKIVITSPAKSENSKFHKSPSRRGSDMLKSVNELEDSFLGATTYYDEWSGSNPVDVSDTGGEVTIVIEHCQSEDNVHCLDNVIIDPDTSHNQDSRHLTDNVIVVEPRISNTTDNQKDEVLPPLPNIDQSQITTQDVDKIANPSLIDDIKDALDDREVCKKLAQQDNQEISNDGSKYEVLIIDVSEDILKEGEMVETTV